MNKNKIDFHKTNNCILRMKSIVEILESVDDSTSIAELLHDFDKAITDIRSEVYKLTQGSEHEHSN